MMGKFNFLWPLSFALLSNASSASATVTLDLPTLHRDLDSAPQSIQTVQSFLEKYIFPLKLDPIFVYDSHSVQYGDQLTPRVLLVTPDRRFTISFAGRPGSTGWETIEIMSVDPNSATRFQFAEIVFPKEDPMYPPQTGSLKPVWNGYGDVETRCGNCHGGGSAGLDAVIPGDGSLDQGVWGGSPAPWPQDVATSWSAFSANMNLPSRYAPLRPWLESATEEKVSATTSDYLSHLN
jgi:hypothetical protein